MNVKITDELEIETVKQLLIRHETIKQEFNSVASTINQRLQRLIEGEGLDPQDYQVDLRTWTIQPVVKVEKKTPTEAGAE